jgi:hypothetical protein
MAQELMAKSPIRFGISTLALSAFFFHVVKILAVVNQPPWHTKAVGKK